MTENIYELDNGMTILLVRDPNSKHNAIVLGSKMGSRHETSKNSELLHLTEHVMFAGSREYPTLSEIESAIADIKSDMNGDLYKDDIIFYIKVPSKHFSKGFKLLTDVFLHPLLLAKTIRNEKNIVIEELCENQDDPREVVEDLFDNTIFSGSRLASATLGSIENIPTLTNSQVDRFWRRLTKPNNLILTVVGNFETKKTLKIIEQTFGHFKPRYTQPIPLFKNDQTEKRISLIQRDTRQIRFQLGFPTFSRKLENYKDYITLGVLNNILSSTYSSRLYIQLRQDEGLLYDITSEIWHYQDIGYLKLVFGVRPANALKVLRFVIQGIKRFKEETVSLKELRQAKKNLCTKADQDFEDELYIAKFYTGQLLSLGKIVPVSEYKKAVKKVTRPAIQKLAQRLFKTEKINLAIVGNIDDKTKEEINKILEL